MVSPARAVESCTITTNAALTFGTLGNPASGSNTYTISASGAAASGTGTLLYGTTSRGQYTLKKTGNGGNFSTITIDIQNINTGSANVSLGSFRGVYGGAAINSFPASGLAKPGTGQGTTLYLGATATYNSSVGAGSMTPSFDIVVVYQ
jgi:hypothetical protein